VGASGRRLDQSFQIMQQRRVVHDAPFLRPAPRPSNPFVLPRGARRCRVNFRNARVDRRARIGLSSCCGTDATAPQRERFSRCPEPSRVFVQHWTQRLNFSVNTLSSRI